MRADAELAVGLDDERNSRKSGRSALARSPLVVRSESQLQLRADFRFDRSVSTEAASTSSGRLPVLAQRRHLAAGTHDARSCPTRGLLNGVTVSLAGERQRRCLLRLASERNARTGKTVFSSRSCLAS